MNAKENAHPIAATMERAAASFSDECSTLSRPRQTVLITDVLPVGAGHAISGRTLAALLGFRDVRQLSKAVERERRRGAPICAAVSGDSRGYFLAASPGELKRYLDSLNRRIGEVCRTRNACEDTLRRMTGQINIVGW